MFADNGMDPDILQVTDFQGQTREWGEDEGLRIVTRIKEQIFNTVPQDQNVMVDGVMDGILTMMESEDPENIAHYLVTQEFKTATYNGTEIKPAFTIEGLEADKDYKVTYPSDCVNAGGKTVTIEGIGDYSGQFEASYTVSKATPNVKITSKYRSIKRKKLRKQSRYLSALKVSGAKGPK